MPTKPTKRARNSKTCYTAEAFREIAEAALEELFENTDTYEIKSLASWTTDFRLVLGHVADRDVVSGIEHAHAVANGDE